MQEGAHGGAAGIQVPSVHAPRQDGPAQAPPSSAASPAFPVLLTDKQAAACLGVSVRKFHDLRKESWVPRPVVLGPRLLRWPRAEMEAAVASMPRQTDTTPEPAQLLRSRIDRAKRTGSLQAGGPA